MLGVGCVALGFLLLVSVARCGLRFPGMVMGGGVAMVALSTEIGLLLNLGFTIPPPPPPTPGPKYDKTTRCRISLINRDYPIPFI